MLAELPLLRLLPCLHSTSQAPFQPKDARDPAQVNNGSLPLLSRPPTDDFFKQTPATSSSARAHLPRPLARWFLPLSDPPCLPVRTAQSTSTLRSSHLVQDRGPPRSGRWATRWTRQLRRNGCSELTLASETPRSDVQRTRRARQGRQPRLPGGLGVIGPRTRSPLVPILRRPPTIRLPLNPPRLLPLCPDRPRFSLLLRNQRQPDRSWRRWYQ